MVFTLEVKYDDLGRIHQWRRKVGASDLKAYEYVYDIDNNVMEVVLNGQPIWKYEHDANNNIVKITEHGESKLLTINQNNQIEGTDKEKFIFDADGFMIKRDEEQFEYNSKGQLVRAFEKGKYNIHYFYDAMDRLVARKDSIGNYLTQFFYADISEKERITHIYDHNTGVYTQLFYDNKGHLFALEQDGRQFYIALDPMGSPILMFNAMGSVVKQMTYDPLGMKMTDSAPEVHFLFGFQCGIVDHITKLIHYGSRVYDPSTGRWTSPAYHDLLHQLNDITINPGIVNLYQNWHIVNRELHHTNYMTGIGFHFVMNCFQQCLSTDNTTNNWLENGILRTWYSS